MEPNENNLKPQPTGGLKLMTVFIAVLALHVVVIGGFTVWHLLYPSGNDTDLALDKTHKAKTVTDSSIGDMPGDGTTPDKTATPATPDSSTAAATDAMSAPGASPAGTTDPTSATPDLSASGSASAPAAAPAPAASAPATPPMVPTMTEDSSPPPATAPAATPAPVVTPATVAATPSLTPPAEASPAAPAASPAPSPTSADTAASAPAPVAGTPYTVKQGDSLARIARRHHITLAELRSANTLKSDRLHIAQVIMIPSPAPKAAPADADAEALATPAPAPAAPAASAPTDAGAADATPAVTPAPATPAVASTAMPHHAHKLDATHHFYTVVKGDTLTKIAKRYHTTTSALVAANGLTNAGRLSIGQKLRIPSREARTAEDKPIEAEPHGATRAQLANNLP